MYSIIYSKEYTRNIALKLINGPTYLVKFSINKIMCINDDILLYN